MTTPPPPTRQGLALRLCPSCRIALGYWTDPEGLCPRCAAIAKEAGE